jgi:uncharacterized protein
MPSEDLIIADSGPLIGLAKIGHLHLLHQIAKRVIVPPTVWYEVTEAKPEAPGAKEVRSADWIEVINSSTGELAAFLEQIDAGEAEALALAHQFPKAILLFDDLAARKLAKQLGFRRMGSLAVLAMARKAGHIEKVRPLAEALIRNGLFIGSNVVEAILKEVGE